MIQILMSILTQWGIFSLSKEKVIAFLWNYEFSRWHLTLIGFVSLLALYFYGRWQVGYFKRRGIKFNDDIKPFFGHSLNTMLMKENFMDIMSRTYKAFPDEKYVGYMQLNKPAIMLRDLDLIKRAGIKEFDHFVDHNFAFSEHVDSIFGNHLFSLNGDKWKDMRATLSPAFTSSKMRGMFGFINETSEQLASYFLDKMTVQENKERGLVEVEMKDVFSRYANDVIATSAFGIKVDSMANPENKFYQISKSITNFSGFQMVKVFLFTSFPRIMKMSKIPLIDEKLKDFYRSLVLDAMKEREEKGIIRPDMIHLLKEARKGTLDHDVTSGEKEASGFATVEESHIGKATVKRNWTDDDIVAQAVLFLIAGFDTSSTFLCFLAHELAINPDVQKKLHEEIDQHISEKGKTLEYGDLANMPYMDMVSSETLRMWPAAVATDRKCIKPFRLPASSDNIGYTIQPGEGIWFPIHGIHHDEKYYPDPEKFDPERFSEENKANIHPMTFIPFGVGPRNCIGSRFALMEAKAVIFHLLANFTFVPTAKTQNPLKMKKNSFTLAAEKGFWIGLEPRN